MKLNCRLDELDDETIAYLKAAGKYRGRGMPGYHVPAENARPWIALIVGAALVIGIPVVTLPPLDSTPMKAAFIQTAFMLPGLWLLVAAVRLLSRGGVGDFDYVDPRHLYRVRGNGVEVIPLGGLSWVKVKNVYGTEKDDDEEEYQEYSHTDITFRCDSGVHTIAARPAGVAGVVAAYLDGLRKADLDADPVAVGFDMKRRAEGVVAFSGLDIHVNEGGDPAKVESAPLRPWRARPSRGGRIAFLLIIAAGVGLFYGMRHVNTKVRDDAVYRLVINERAPWLRKYLLDPNCGRHEAAVRKTLDSRYKNSAAGLRTKRSEPGPLNRALAELVWRLRSEEDYPHPIVSLRVRDAADAKSGVAEKLAEALADELTARVGSELVAFVKTPTGAEAMIDLTYRLDRDSGGVLRSATATLTIRPGPDAEPLAREEFVVPAAGGRVGLSNAVVAALGLEPAVMITRMKKR